MNDSPEQEMAQRVIEELKRHWQFWNNPVENKGEEDTFDTKAYEFAVDRRAEDESLFTADQVTILRLNEPIEDLARVPEGLKTEEGEEWIQITVCPKNPYHPMLGIFSDRENDFYYTEALIIFLSNQGRAFEQTRWDQTLSPDIHQPQRQYYSYLKSVPELEEIQVRFTREPEEVFTELFQPLKGQSLERLGFLAMKVKTGDIIEQPT